MNSEIIIIPLLISIFVSFLFWILIYLVPSIYPKEVANFIFSLKRTIPDEPLEIGLIINQFLNKSTWERLFAIKIMDKLFQEKIIQLESKKYDEWKEELELQKELLELRKLSDDEILHLETGKALKKKYGNVLKSSENLESPFYLNRFEEEFITMRKEKEREILDFKDNYKNCKIWSLKNRNFLKFIQDKVFTNQSIDLEKISSSSPEWSLINIWGMKPPEKYPEGLFKEIILYLDLHSGEKTGEKLIKEFSIALSSHEKSIFYLEKIIYAMEYSENS